MINPKQFSWLGSSEREDNTPYLATDRRGYNVSIRPVSALADSPDGYVVFTATSQAYDFIMPMTDLGSPLTEGDWLANVQDEDTGGRKSAWSADLAITIVTAVPKSPTGFVAS